MAICLRQAERDTVEGRERERERERERPQTEERKTKKGREKDQERKRETRRTEEREREQETERQTARRERETPRKGSENVLIKKKVHRMKEKVRGKKKSFTLGRNSPVPTSYLMSLERKRSSLPLSLSLSRDRQLSLPSPVVGAYAARARWMRRVRPAALMPGITVEARLQQGTAGSIHRSWQSGASFDNPLSPEWGRRTRWTLAAHSPQLIISFSGGNGIEFSLITNANDVAGLAVPAVIHAPL